MSLTIPIERSGEPLFRQIYAGLRQAIVAGSLKSGERLPSTRMLAEHLKVSRTIVVLAYEQLLAEGFVVGRVGAGTFVAEGLDPARPGLPAESARLRLSRYGEAASLIAPTLDRPPAASDAIRHDFVYGRGGPAQFPFEAWRRILIRQDRNISRHAFGYANAAGEPDLREAIAGHLRRARAVRCDASQVLVVNGSQQALDLIARVLVEAGDPVVIEDPQYTGAREILRAAGARLRPVPVDRDGIDTAKLEEDARLAFVTPSHQFPTGAILPLARRLALLAWADHNDAIVVEDDYDGEFRYEGQPLESLQGLDRAGRVIYVGTFSRTMFASLRLGYLVVPAPLVPAFTAAKWLSDRHTASLEQRALAEFINGGQYERHLRRLRRLNTDRRAALLEAMATHLPASLEVTGDGAGAHIAIWLDGRLAEQEAIERAASRGVGVYGVSRYFLGPSRPGFLLGYAQLGVEDIRAGIASLGDALNAP